jgi:nicotinamide phosphoribosyltransferase
MTNIIKLFDSYKVSHWKCYPKDIQKMYTYFESRGGEYPTTVFFGLQYYLKKYLEGTQVTQEKIDEAEEFWFNHLGRKDIFNRKGWEFIAKEYDGNLPIRVEAVPEGTEVPTLNCLMTIVNTDHQSSFLSNCLETLISKLWYSTTIATRSYYIRKNLQKLIDKTGDPSSIYFKCHDFGQRGTSSEETASIGGAAHLLSFMGTDTVNGIKMLQDYYQAGMCGFSIPATEHSVMCSFGRDNEIAACENFLNEFPTGLIACVSDQYDVRNCVKNIWGGVLREKVLKRDGTLVIRPDSGDCMEIVPWILNSLWDSFGGITNDKGYKVLDSHVRAIQGDGMNPDSIQKLFEHVANLGWSTDNLVVGSGGGLLQNATRDLNKFAVKCSSVLRGDRWIDVYKEPITDSGKRSKSGRFQTVKFPDGRIETRDYTYAGAGGVNLLQPVFENGKILKTYTLEEVKKNLFG